MCIIMSDDLLVGKTEVVCVQLPLPEGNVYATIYRNKAVTQDEDPSRQVVLIPFPHDPEHNHHLCVLELTTAQESQLFGTLGNDYPPPNYVDFIQPQSATKSFTFDMDNALAVCEMNGYCMTLAPTLADLQARVCWDAFSLSPDHATYMADLATRYGNGYGFVIARPLPAKAATAFYCSSGGTLAWTHVAPYACLPTGCEPQPGNTHYDVSGWFIRPLHPTPSYVAWCDDSNEILPDVLEVVRNARRSALPAALAHVHNYSVKKYTQHAAVAALSRIRPIEPITGLEDTIVLIDAAMPCQIVAVRLDGSLQHNAHIIAVVCDNEQVYSESNNEDLPLCLESDLLLSPWPSWW
jgi:hypothetical protein